MAQSHGSQNNFHKYSQSRGCQTEFPDAPTHQTHVQDHWKCLSSRLEAPITYTYAENELRSFRAPGNELRPCRCS